MQNNVNMAVEPWLEQVNPTESEAQPTIEILVRSMGESYGTDRQERLIDKLLALRRQDIVDEVDIRALGTSVRQDASMQNTTVCEDVVETLSAIGDWKNRNDDIVDLPIEHRTVNDTFRQEHYQKWAIPTLCLAVYRGDELVGVFPHTRASGEQVSIEDFLDAMSQSRQAEQDIQTSV